MIGLGALNAAAAIAIAEANGCTAVAGHETDFAGIGLTNPLRAGRR